MTIKAEVLFFGVRAGSRAGHYLTAPNGYAGESELLRDLPAALRRIDSVWCWPVPRTPEEVGNPQYGRDETEGRGFVHYVDGWTVIAWWDRSADARGGCNAAFLVRGRHVWTDALTLARAAFPSELARMEAHYTIGLAGADLPPDGTASAAAAFVETFRALHPDVQTAVRGILRLR